MQEGDAEAGAAVEEASAEEPAAEELERRAEEEGEEAPPMAAVEAVERGRPRVARRLPDRVGEVAVGEVEERGVEVPHRAVDLDRLVDTAPSRAESSRAEAEAELAVGPPGPVPDRLAADVRQARHPEPRGVARRLDRGEDGTRERVRDALVRVEDEDPVVRREGERPIARRDVPVPRDRLDARPGGSRERDGPVRGAGVDDEDLVGPADRLQRWPEPVGLVLHHEDDGDGGPHRSIILDAVRILAVDLGRQWRGGQSQTLHVSRELDARGHDVTVGVTAGSALADRAVAAGLEVVPLPAAAEVSPSLLVALVRETRRVRPDVGWAGDAKAHGAVVWSGAARRAPLVVHRRVVFLPGRQPLARVKYAVAARYLAVSEAAGAALRRYGVPAEKVRVVPDGLPPGAFVERPAAAAPPHRLVHAGAFDGRKGQAVVVEVLARLAGAGLDARATFLGDGPDRPRVEERARSLGVLGRCAFEGRVEDVGARLAASHLLLLPSESEAAPLVLLEAMAAGCAVLAHDTGGVAEMTRGGACGRLLSTLDAGAWADEARRLLADDGARATLIAAGREAVAGRTTERTATLVEAELERAARS